MSRTILSFALRISYREHIDPGRIFSVPVIFAASAPLRETKSSTANEISHKDAEDAKKLVN
ncbi:MAG: hypothetical protein DMF76_16425 [Acidobacteria bacterium]|nr:MAG: hypothetical protein DMF76_16425 [Acidobacteriota bacterium]